MGELVLKCTKRLRISKRMKEFIVREAGDRSLETEVGRPKTVVRRRQLADGSQQSPATRNQ